MTPSLVTLLEAAEYKFLAKGDKVKFELDGKQYFGTITQDTYPPNHEAVVRFDNNGYTDTEVIETNLITKIV